MNNERSLGVTEARLGLTLLTSLLVVLGYVVLQRLSGAGQPPPMQIHPQQSAETYANEADGPQPGKLPIQRNDVPALVYPRTTERPQWLAPEPDEDNANRHDPNPTTPFNGFGVPEPIHPQSIQSKSAPLDQIWSQ
jgi:hypothetical protein